MADSHVTRVLGRPPKFAEPTRVVTVTLPESTLRALGEIDQDRARAIVHATNIALAAKDDHGESFIDLVAVNDKSAVITVPFCQALADTKGLTLLRFHPGRYLVMLEPGVSLPEIEVSLLDLVDAQEAGSEDRVLLSQLIERLRAFRRSRRTTMGEVILVAI